MVNIISQNFNGVTPPAIPTGWTLSPASGSNIVTTSTLAAGGSGNSVTQFTGTSSIVVLMNNIQDTNGGNVIASVDFALDSDSQDLFLFARANNVSGPDTFYFAAIKTTALAGFGASSGFGIVLGKFVSGTPTVFSDVGLGDLSNYAANVFYTMFLTANGLSIKLEIQRKSDGFWEQPDGTFAATKVTFKQATDSSITGAGYTGLGWNKLAATASNKVIYADNFSLDTATIVPVADYYFAPASQGGSDSNPGTISQPFATIAKANSLSLVPGCTLNFMGGQSFSGSLTITTSGTLANPILVRSYGTGKATINAGTYLGAAIGGGAPGDGWGVRIKNASYVKLSNIILRGSGVNITTGVSTSGSTNGTQSPSNNTVGVGVDLVSDVSGTGVYFAGNEISNCDVAGFYQPMYIRAEPSATGTNAKGFSDVKIIGNKFHDSLHFGIFTYGGNSAQKGVAPFFFYKSRCHSNVTIQDNEIYNVPGDPNNTIASGVMIQLNNVTGYLIERNVVHDGTSLVGKLNDNYASFASGGGGGIIPLEADSGIVQFNEAYNLTTGLTYDACGFDLDGNVFDSIMQFNYSHDNYGAGYQTGRINSDPSATNNIFRYNLSINDCRNPKGQGAEGAPQGALNDFGAVNTLWYQNTIYVGTRAGGTGAQPACIRTTGTGTGFKFFNNAFITEGGCTFFAETGASVFYGNGYWNTSATPTWKPTGTAGTVYTSLAALRALGEGAELHSGQPTGIYADPKFKSAASHPTLGLGVSTKTLTAYDLDKTSPYINAGIAYAAYSITAPTLDYHGGIVPASGGGFDIGAIEYGAIVPGGSGTTDVFISLGQEPTKARYLANANTTSLSDLLGTLSPEAANAFKKGANQQTLINLGVRPEIASRLVS